MIDRLPSLFLRVEGAAVLVAALVLYFDLGYEWCSSCCSCLRRT